MKRFSPGASHICRGATMFLSRFFFPAGLAAALVPFAHAQDRDRDRDRGHDWERAHDVISRTMEDLGHIERREAFAGSDRERYDHAMRALADVDRQVSEGRLDRGKLDDAIEQ